MKPGQPGPPDQARPDTRQWPKLAVYVVDGCLSIGSNLNENATRRFVIGRENGTALGLIRATTLVSAKIPNSLPCL